MHTFGQQAREYLNFNKSTISAIKDYLLLCKSCSRNEMNLFSSFTFLKKYLSKHNSKIREALSIKKAKHFLKSSYMQMIVPSCQKYFNLFVLFGDNLGSISNYCSCRYFEKLLVIV